MCTSIVSNRNKTMIGWNLDILDMEYRVAAEDDRVYIAIKDEKEGWLPLFGANHRGDFVAMPTCWPHDARSNPVSDTEPNIINLDIELLLENKTLQDIKQFPRLYVQRLFPWCSMWKKMRYTGVKIRNGIE